MAHEEGNHSVSVTAGIIASLVFGAAVGWWFISHGAAQPVDDTSFAFAKVQVDEGKLTRERKAVEATVPESAKSLALALDQAVRGANLAQFGQAKLPPKQQELAIQFAADDLAVAVNDGYERFVSLGEDLNQTCINAFEGVQRALRDKSLTYEAATTGVQPGFEVYAEACGNALPVLKQLALVDEQGQWTDPSLGPVLLEIFNRLRFAHIMSLRKNPILMLTPHEREILYRWRIANKSIGDPDRLRFINDAEQYIPGFSANEARGRFYFEKGDFTRAKAEFDGACAKRPADNQLQAYCRYLEKRTGGTQPSHE